MDIIEFLQQSCGKWFSKRTGHHLAGRQFENGKSDMRVEMIATDDPVVIKLCESSIVDPALVVCGMRISWDGTMDGDSKKYVGSTVLVPVADPDTPRTGIMLYDTSRQTGQAPVTARYTMGDDDALLLIMDSETLFLEERLWFASPNLRLRTSVVKRSGGFSVAYFCSEIRMGGVQPPATSPATASGVAD